MALPADFSKIFGSAATGGLTPIGDVNYAKGWEFVGANPPTKNDFTYLQNLSDLKSQWLYNNKLQRTDPFGDIKADGAVKKALENLGLGDGSALPVGVPVPWPLATPPTGWLKCNGAPFSAAEYPGLAKAYPTNTLPDLRGEFIRGWDDGRGVDPSRNLGSSQTDQLQNHGHSNIRMSHTGAFGGSGALPDGWEARTGDADLVGPVSSTNFAGGQPRVGAETRPRNVAFNYIVRAA